MKLQDSLYKILSQDGGTFEVTMLEGHPVYEGHFPGQPITPGVLSLAMVRECASLLCGGELRYSAIKNCRLTAMIRPGERLIITIAIDQDLQLTATVATPDGEQKLQLDATLFKVES